MIQAVILFNTRGVVRMKKFYQDYPEHKQQQIIKSIYQTLMKRDSNSCNFMKAGDILGDKNSKIIYQRYGTMYIVFCVDDSESELAILNLIQVFIETLQKMYKNVCELDIIFQLDKVHYVLNEMIIGGLVCATTSEEILEAYEAQKKIEIREIPVFYHESH